MGSLESEAPPETPSRPLALSSGAPGDHRAGRAPGGIGPRRSCRPGSCIHGLDRPRRGARRSQAPSRASRSTRHSPRSTTPYMNGRNHEQIPTSSGGTCCRSVLRSGLSCGLWGSSHRKHSRRRQHEGDPLRRGDHLGRSLARRNDPDPLELPEQRPDPITYTDHRGPDRHQRTGVPGRGRGRLSVIRSHPRRTGTASCGSGCLHLAARVRRVHPFVVRRVGSGGGRARPLPELGRERNLLCVEPWRRRWWRTPGRGV